MSDPEFVPTHLVRFGIVGVPVRVPPGAEDPLLTAAAAALASFTDINPEVIDLSEPMVSHIVRREDIAEWWA